MDKPISGQTDQLWWFKPTLFSLITLIFSWALLAKSRSEDHATRTKLPGTNLAIPKHPFERINIPKRITQSQKQINFSIDGRCQSIKASFDSKETGVTIKGTDVYIDIPDSEIGFHRIEIDTEHCTDNTSSWGGSHYYRIMLLPAKLPSPKLTISPIKGEATADTLIKAVVTGIPGTKVELVSLEPNEKESAEANKAASFNPMVLAKESLEERYSASINLPMKLEDAQSLRARLLPISDIDTFEPSSWSDPPTLLTDDDSNLSLSSAKLALHIGTEGIELTGDALIPVKSLGDYASRYDFSIGITIVPDNGLFSGTEKVVLFCDYYDDRFISKKADHIRLKAHCKKRYTAHIYDRLFHKGTSIELGIGMLSKDVWGKSEFMNLYTEIIETTLEVSTDKDVKLTATDTLPRAANLTSRTHTWESSSDRVYISGIRFFSEAKFPVINIPEPVIIFPNDLIRYRLFRSSVEPYRIVSTAQDILSLLLKLLPVIIIYSVLQQFSLSRLIILLMGCGIAQSSLHWLRFLTGISWSEQGKWFDIVTVLWQITALYWICLTCVKFRLFKKIYWSIIWLVILPITLAEIWLYLIQKFKQIPTWISWVLPVVLFSTVLLVTGLRYIYKTLGKSNLLTYIIAVIISAILLLGRGYMQTDVAYRLACWLPAIFAISIVWGINNGKFSTDTDYQILLLPSLLILAPVSGLDHGIPLTLIIGIALSYSWKRHVRNREFVPFTTLSASEESAKQLEREAILLATGTHPLKELKDAQEQLEKQARTGQLVPEGYRFSAERILRTEQELRAAGFTTSYSEIPEFLSFNTFEGTIKDGIRSVKYSMLPISACIFYLAILKGPFEPQRILGNIADLLELLIKFGITTFLFGLLFSFVPGKNGLTKSLVATLAYMAFFAPAAMFNWRSIEDLGAALIDWGTMLFILTVVGLLAFDLRRVAAVKSNYWEAIISLTHIRGYRQILAGATSLIIAILAAVSSGATGKIADIVTRINISK